MVRALRQFDAHSRKIAAVHHTFDAQASKKRYVHQQAEIVPAARAVTKYRIMGVVNGKPLTEWPVADRPKIIGDFRSIFGHFPLTLLQ